MTTFKDLGLAGTVLRALEREGYSAPTPIQAKAIPNLLKGRDLLGIAQTGTGKTAAFALPILERLAADRQPPVSRRTRVLVLAPTRELAAQIDESFRTYGRGAHMQTAVVFGGVSYGPQIKALQRGLDVLTATPGRLIDLLDRGALKLDGTEILVLDEADHMLDLGFIVPVRRIIGALPVRRQTLLFSATMPKEIEKLAAEILRDPITISVKPAGATADRVRQSLYLVNGPAKTGLLAHLLTSKTFERTLVFTRTKRGADRVAAALGKSNISAVAIHGNKSQAQRERALAQFRNGAARVMVATDIAARGIDIDGITHVVNYDLPDVPETYVHRIGRTARAGADGEGIAFCAPDERANLRAIEKLTGQKIEAFAWDEARAVMAIAADRDNAADTMPERRTPGRKQPARNRKPNNTSPVSHAQDRGHKRHDARKAMGNKKAAQPNFSARRTDSPDRLPAEASGLTQTPGGHKRHRNRAGQRRRRRMASEAAAQPAMG